MNTPTRSNSMQLKDILAPGNVRTNISFIYNIERGQLEFIDKELAAALQLGLTAGGDEIIALINNEELPVLKKSFKKLLSGSFSGDVQLKINDGSTERWFKITPFLLQTDEEKLIAGNVTDITAQVIHQYSIHKYANKKNSTLVMLAHDLRGPLGVARMLTQTIGKTADETSRMIQSENLQKVLKQSIELINDIVQREADETMKIDLVKKNLDVATKLKEYMDELRLSEDDIHRTFTFSSSAENIYANIDESKFMQVLNNLVSNALKFTRDGDTISLKVEQKRDRLLFTFSDTGVGIPKKFHAELFDKFTPARRKGLHGEPTIGLGLSIIKTIIDWHQGTISVESEENKGTTFYFEIPIGE